MEGKATMAKELKELIYKYQAINCVHNHFANKDHILASIVCLPTIEAEPVKHGHWIDKQNGRWIYAECSHCKTVHDVKSNYCPNCGAQMIDEVKE